MESKQENKATKVAFREICSASKVFTDEYSVGANSYFEVNNKASIIFQGGAAFGEGSKIVLKDGGSIIIVSGKELKIGINSTIDAKGGVLVARGAKVTIGDNSRFMLSEYAAIGGTYIASYSNGDFNSKLEVGKGNNEFNNENVGVKFIAPPKQVFSGNVSFQGKWIMPVAYAEWFTDMNCNDWSVPINKAIEMKKAGIVMLPKGNLKVQNTIFVTQGITLQGIPKSEGKATFNSFVTLNNETGEKEVSVTNERTGTTLIPYGTEGSANKTNNFVFGCMILVNINPAYIEEAKKRNLAFEKIQRTPEFVNTETIDGEKKSINIYVGETRHHSPGTVLRDFAIDNTSKQLSQIRQLRGIFVSGSTSFEYLTFVNLWQAIAWAYTYNDRKRVVYCTVDHPLNKKTSDTNPFDPEFINPKMVGINDSDYPNMQYQPDEYDLPYAFDLGKLGDALCFKYNSVGTSCRNALRVFESGGGTVSDNILNADVQIEKCKNVEFANNHLEESAQVRIIQSTVDVLNNFFHKTSRENIVISGGVGGFGGSIVNLANNSFIFFQNYTYPNVHGEITSENVSKYDISIFEARSYYKGTSASDTMTDVPDLNIINMRDNYRLWSYHGQFSRINTFGITLSKSTRTNQLNSNNTVAKSSVSISDYTDFNNRSHFLSSRCRLMPKGKIEDYSYVVNGLQNTIKSTFGYSSVNKIAVKADKNEYRYWTYNAGYYRYSTQIVFDSGRRIALPIQYQTPVQGNVGGAVKIEAPKIQNPPSNDNDETINNRIYEFVKINLNNYIAGLALYGNAFLVRLVRETLDENGRTLNYHVVSIPVCQGMELYDFGTHVSGFKWILRPASMVPNVSNFFYIPATEVDSISDTPSAYSARVVEDLIDDNWKNGDILINLNKNSDWDFKIVK